MLRAAIALFAGISQVVLCEPVQAPTGDPVLDAPRTRGYARPPLLSPPEPLSYEALLSTADPLEAFDQWEPGVGQEIRRRLDVFDCPYAGALVRRYEAGGYLGYQVFVKDRRGRPACTSWLDEASVVQREVVQRRAKATPGGCPPVPAPSP